MGRQNKALKASRVRHGKQVGWSREECNDVKDKTGRQKGQVKALSSVSIVLFVVILFAVVLVWLKKSLLSF